MTLDNCDIILHIGSHKTGSTSIQASLRQTCQLLRDHPEPILYPVGGRGEERSAHHRMAHHFTHKAIARYTRHFKLFVREVSAFDQGRVLASSEAFELASPQHVAAEFDRVFKGQKRVGIMRYIRPSFSRVLSQWDQRQTVNWNIPPLHRYIQMQAKTGSLYDALILWDKTFEGRMLIRPFLPALFPDRNVVNDFFNRVIGPDHPATRDAATHAWRNTGRNAAVLLMVERCKPEIDRLLAAQGLLVAKNAKRLLKDLRTALLPHCAHSTARLRLPHDNMHARYTAGIGEARQIDARFFEDRHFETAFDAAMGACPEGTALLTAEEALGLSGREVDRIVAHVSEEIADTYIAHIKNGFPQKAVLRA